MDVMTRRLVPAEAVQVIPVDESLVLVDARSGQYFGLNEVGACIWRLIEQGKDADAIVEVIDAEFDGGPDAIAADTRRILGELADAGLLQ
jgi:hypothetical protein